MDTAITDTLRKAEAFVRMKLDSHLRSDQMPALRTLMAATAAAATMSPTVQLIAGNRGRRLKVLVAGGTTGSGTVRVTGTVDGATKAVTLTLTANGSASTTDMFTAITLTNGVATTGLTSETAVPTVALYQHIEEEIRDIVADLAASYFYDAYNITLSPEQRTSVGVDYKKAAIEALDDYIKDALNPTTYEEEPRFLRGAS
jgi:hypothetical protein